MQTLDPAPISGQEPADDVLPDEVAPPGITTEDRTSEAPAEPAPALGRVPAFDGFRGSAMVLVLLSHVWVLMPAGFRESLGPATGLFNSGSLGVVIFLVLGGFLVTTGLLETRESTGSMGLRHFWSRRLVRICGPLFAMLAVLVVVAWAESFRGSTPASTMRSVWRVATFTFNWALIENPGGVRPDLGHLWYLSVEQQFYVVWVLVLAVLWRRRGLLGALLAASAVGVMTRTLGGVLPLRAAALVRGTRLGSIHSTRLWSSGYRPTGTSSSPAQCSADDSPSAPASSTTAPPRSTSTPW